MTSLAGVGAKDLRTAAFGATAAFSSSSSSNAEFPLPAVSVESARLFTEAVSRVLHLHDDPRPFAGLCLEFAGAAAAAAAAAAASSGGDGGGRESPEDRESSGHDSDGGDGGRGNGAGAGGGGRTSSPMAKACEGKLSG